MNNSICEVDNSLSRYPSKTYPSKLLLIKYEDSRMYNPIWIDENPLIKKLDVFELSFFILSITLARYKMKPAEQYILNQPEPFKSILVHLQILIENSFPEVKLEFKWKIPFYYLEGKPFCYLNPSKRKGYVDVGFWLSSHLEKFEEHLISDKRKVVKSLRYVSVDDINEEVLISVLKEAFKKKEKGFYKQ